MISSGMSNNTASQDPMPDASKDSLESRNGEADQNVSTETGGTGEVSYGISDLGTPVRIISADDYESSREDYSEQ